MTISDNATSGVIFIVAGLAILWAFIQFYIISLTPVKSADETEGKFTSFNPTSSAQHLMNNDVEEDRVDMRAKHASLLVEIYEAIREGAKAFLYAEYRICFVFCVAFAAV